MSALCRGGVRQARTGEESCRDDNGEDLEWDHLTLPLSVDLGGQDVFACFLPLVLEVGCCAAALEASGACVFLVTLAISKTPSGVPPSA